MKPKEPTVPPPSPDTVRHRIVLLLEEGEPRSARELSHLARISEKDVYAHLEEIGRHRQGRRLVIVPAECRGCGFVFHKRERVKKPGRCPVCRSEHIAEPLFFLSPPGREKS
ncbi:transcriptional regulator [Geobacter sp.]|uniref:transcriptional regulator n=1 Tax=Geobacter sp. TaxID=46610 RepID=UPI0026186C56|nr:transcriptional regulator [Geobacter sp.]